MTTKKKTKKKRVSAKVYQARTGEKDVLSVKLPSELKADFHKMAQNSTPKCTASQHVVQAMIEYRENNKHLLEE